MTYGYLFKNIPNRFYCIIVGSGETFFVVGKPEKSVSPSPVKLPLLPVAKLHTFYKLTFFGAAYVRSYTAISCFMFHFNFISTDFFNQSDGRVDRVARSVAVASGSIRSLIKTTT